MQITGFKDEIGIVRADFENWVRKLNLVTDYAPTTPGVPRDFSRENVLELAVIAAMRNAGCELRSAAAYAASVVRNDRAGVLRPWFVFPAGDFTQGRATDDPSREAFAEMAAKSPHRTATAIHVGAIVATVNQLFAEKDAN